MKRVVLAGMSALAAISMMGAANAADLGRPAMPAKAPAYVAPYYNWTGAYAGINGGGGFGHSDWLLPAGTSGFDTSGGLVGGTLGYNYQMGHLVLGIEGDADYSTIKGDTTAATGICTGISCETRNDWLATARGRLGYAFDRVMPFVTAGGAFGDVKLTPNGLRQRDRNARRLDRRRRRGNRTQRAVEREAGIPLRRSRQGQLHRDHLRRADRRQLYQQRGACRHQLPLLVSGRPKPKQESRSESSGTFSLGTIFHVVLATSFNYRLREPAKQEQGADACVE